MVYVLSSLVMKCKQSAQRPVFKTAHYYFKSSSLILQNIEATGTAMFLVCNFYSGKNHFTADSGELSLLIFRTSYFLVLKIKTYI